MSGPRIGLLADIQYGDLPDRGSCRFRSSLQRLEAAVEDLNRRGCDLVLQLGDIIEGHVDRRAAAAVAAGDPAASAPTALERSRRDLEAVLEVLSRLEAPVEHVVGNHCLAIPRDELQGRLGIEAPWRLRRVGELRVALLDSTCLSPLGNEGGPTRSEEEDELLQAHAGAPWALPWNGAFGAEQLTWLGGVLAEGGPLLIASHHPVLPAAARSAFLAWDHEAGLRLLEDARVGGPRLWVSGHDHRGGRGLHAGVDFRTLEGMVAGSGGACVDLIGRDLGRFSWPS